MIHFVQTGHPIDAVVDGDDNLLAVRFKAEPPIPNAKVQFIEWPKGRQGWATVTWMAES